MTDLEEIKSKIDIVDFIGRSIELKKSGMNYKGICPFHGEKTPSFMVSADKQIWHCFGCGRGGDIFKFVMEKEGFGFVEALKMLAETAGVQLTNVPKGETDERRNLISMNEWAAKVYAKTLTDSSEGRAAKQYLLNRGLTPETIERFRLGFAPTSGRVLTEALTRRGYTPEQIEKAGLASMRGKYAYDKFVGRIMFPLADNTGRVVGFTGRVMTDAQQPKYLNSPETAIFHKSEMLYGLDLAKNTIQQARKVVLVEGQMDTISSQQAGVTNTVGISGTALTETQLQILSRYADEIVLSLDADSAGSEATKRAISLAAQFDMTIKIALLGEHKDPDAIIKESAEAWQKVVEQAVSVMDFYFESVTKRYDLQGLEGRKSAARELLSVISKLSDPMERDHYVKRLARMVSVDPVVLYDTIKAIKPVRRTVGASHEKAPETKPDIREEVAVVMPVVYPHLIPLFLSLGKEIKWASSLANTIYGSIASWYNAGDQFVADEFALGIPEPDRTNLLELMLVVEEDYRNVEPAEIERELRFQLAGLSAKTFNATRSDLAKRIAEAEEEHNEDKLRELLAQLKDL